jgi:hypothetical protein
MPQPGAPKDRTMIVLVYILSIFFNLLAETGAANKYGGFLSIIYLPKKTTKHIKPL